MDNKKNAIFTIAFIASVIFIFTLIDVFHGDRIFSETENRLLAVKPKFSVETLLSGSYTADYEKYLTDQFVGRDKWIRLKTETDILLQKQEVGGVYLAKNHYLIEQHLPEDYPSEEVEKKLELLEKLTKEWDTTVMLVPTADIILADKLPSNAPCYDQSALLEQVSEILDEGQYVNVYQVLKEHSGEEIYYRTDHHWTSLGAYYGYLAWAQAMGEEPYPYDPAAMTTVTEEFLGTLHSKVNLDWQPDSIQYFPETARTNVKVVYDLQTETDTLYEEKYLETKNKYGFFLDDNHAIVEITTSQKNGKMLFVLKDSYANCLIPLLTAHYERIYVVDLRYFNGRLFSLMETVEPEGGMDVLVLYNCIHFLEEFSFW